MVARQWLFAGITFLHDLFTAFWVGGLLTLGLTVVPVSRKILPTKKHALRLMDAIQARLRVFVYVSMGGLAITGMLLSRRNPAYGAPFAFRGGASTLLSIKHLLMLAMVVVALVRSLWKGDEDQSRRERVQKIKMILLYVNMLLGIAVLAVTALGVAATGGAPGA